MMKRNSIILAMLLAAATFGFTACSSDDDRFSVDYEEGKYLTEVSNLIGTVGYNKQMKTWYIDYWESYPLLRYDNFSHMTFYYPDELPAEYQVVGTEVTFSGKVFATTDTFMHTWDKLQERAEFKWWDTDHFTIRLTNICRGIKEDVDDNHPDVPNIGEVVTEETRGAYEGEFYPEGTTWDEIIYDRRFPDYCILRRFTVEGTSEQSGKQYKQVKCEVLRNSQDACGYIKEANIASSDVIYLREKGSKVYVRDGQTANADEVLYYDFDWADKSSEWVSCGRRQPFNSIADELNQVKLSDLHTYDCVGSKYRRELRTIGNLSSILLYDEPLPDTAVYRAVVSFTRNGKMLFFNHKFSQYYQLMD